MSRRLPAAYAQIMKPTPGTALAAVSIRQAARGAWRGLIQVLAAPDAAPARQAALSGIRNPAERRIT